MITGEGGFVHRMMPPTKWDCGSIPEACFNKELSAREIEAVILPIYLEESRLTSLADSDDSWELMRARWALEMLAEIDADTIWLWNQCAEAECNGKT